MIAGKPCPACHVDEFPPPSGEHGMSYALGIVVARVWSFDQALAMMCDRHTIQIEHWIKVAQAPAEQALDLFRSVIGEERRS